MKCITELKDWDFKIPELGFEKRVTLPYTWNVENERPVQLYRGSAEYTTEIELDEMPWDRAVLYFGCVFHTARVFVNGIPAGGHTGSGYTPFEHSRKCLSQLKQAGCVFTRFHWQQDRKILDWCDENGLMV